MAKFNFQVKIGDTRYQANLDQPLDISIPLRHGDHNPNAWHANAPRFAPVKQDGFVGSVQAGSPVNFFEASFNPHGNGTHTECVGHIAPEQFAIHQALGNAFFVAQLVSIHPETAGNDQFITRPQLSAYHLHRAEALIIRTLPNNAEKKERNYSGSNPPFITEGAMDWIAANGIKHLLVDMPSVDKEADDGKLAAHKTFWHYPENPRLEATITEMVYVPGHIEDGQYLLNLQIPPMMLDAAPSRPYLFELNPLSA